MTRAVCIVVVKVCAVVAQPGHTKELHPVQLELERGLRIVDSPGVIFDVDDPISVGGCASSPYSSSRSHLRIVTSRGGPCTDANRKIDERSMAYPRSRRRSSFFTMLVLSTGRLLKVRLSRSLLQNSKNLLSPRMAPLTSSLRRVASCPHRLEPPKIPFFSEPPALHATHIPSTIPGIGGQVAPGAEATSQPQIVTARRRVST
jgi:nuclear GTP-binding protein